MDTLLLEHDYDIVPFGYDIPLDWQTVPGDIQPDVPESRLVRKRQQLENLSKAIIKVCFSSINVQLLYVCLTNRSFHAKSCIYCLIKINNEIVESYYCNSNMLHPSYASNLYRFVLSMWTLW